MMMQEIPVPPAPPPVPEVVIPDIGQHMPVIMTGDDIAKIVVFSMMGLAVVVWLIARGPIGMAIGAAIRRMAGVDRPAALPGELEALRSEVDVLRGQLGEMAERQEFTERMLAQVRRERLPGSQDVAG
jgi:hypothetical protein